MSIVLPRLARGVAEAMIAEARGLQDLTQLTERLPDEMADVTWPPVGNTRINSAQLYALRADICRLAKEHGMPHSIRTPTGFDAATAGLLHTQLEISPHEASQDEAWSYLTCCWLLDVAMWRFGSNADTRRFIGDLNRNTFRRLWWRLEILGPEIDLAQLGEDEMVNIMERPTIASDPWLAQAIAIQFLEQVARYPDLPRMHLMRETTKRLLRLTPFIDFASLDDGDLNAQVLTALDASAAALSRKPLPTTTRTTALSKRAPSPEVFAVERVTLTDRSEAAAHDIAREPTPAAANGRSMLSIQQAALAATDIAIRTGRVTNQILRELLAISSAEARGILQFGVDEGLLSRRGERRGTYYTPRSRGESGEDVGETQQEAPITGHAGRNADTVLRRLLRRRG